ncbi:hypothetical protein DSOUD_1890 [Desulfuromonas soudanensis]|jgi:hypothetical protein|uniref:Uncharacterized protein n=1 Tax=Desulfuromonas soudanensis TaxID=1603606 RepID=A0A0M4DHT1_9BACT|nr:hypothetical protein [Desulfuromonas soudanensis]ALC16662.1 hypothetical protein DSOUD_1890 [Desulfuromonas soudanensis]
MTTPGERVAAEVRARLEKLHFYVDSLTNVERSKLAARYLRKIPSQYRLELLQRSTIAQLAFCEVFSRETYGW